MVIEYDTAQALIPDGALWKVQYSDERGSHSLAGALTSQAGDFSERLSYKLPEWSYEEEWRLLANQQGLRKLEIPISRVITGPLMGPADKSRVVEAIRKHHRYPRFAQLTSQEGDQLFLHDLAGQSGAHVME